MFHFRFFRACIRRERGRCGLQVRAAAGENAFRLESAAINTRALNGALKCRNDGLLIPSSKDPAVTNVTTTCISKLNVTQFYLPPAFRQNWFRCFVVQCLSVFADSKKGGLATDIFVGDVDRYCSTRLSCFTRSSLLQGQAVTSMGPFVISLMTDRIETLIEDINVGFNLEYNQLFC